MEDTYSVSPHILRDEGRFVTVPADEGGRRGLAVFANRGGPSLWPRASTSRSTLRLSPPRKWRLRKVGLWPPRGEAS
jgi:hypothetical protein